MSKVDTFSVIQRDGYETIVYPKYTLLDERKGSVVILHGMCEHHERYYPFADFLNEQGYDVYMYDHRGHGTDKKLEDLGFIADKDGNQILIEDGIGVLTYVSKIKRTERLILFSHSMGSIVGRNIIQTYDDMDKAIFMGTANPPSLTSRFGIMLSSMIIKLKGPKYVSKFLYKSMFETKVYRKVCERTVYDWLTRNNHIVGAYINDPYCGFPATTAFLRDIIKLSLYAALPSNTEKTRKDLPILLVSGTNDPVGNCGKDVSRLFKQYQHQGFKNIDCILYKDCRHELVNELNNDVIMQDLVKWMN